MTATTATPVLNDARFKAVRRVKNRFKANVNRRIGLYTRSIAVAKDKGKIKILQAKIEQLQYAVALIDEL